jgi:hypothetical protein
MVVHWATAHGEVDMEEGDLNCQGKPGSIEDRTTTSTVAKLFLFNPTKRRRKKEGKKNKKQVWETRGLCGRGPTGASGT